MTKIKHLILILSSIIIGIILIEIIYNIFLRENVIGGSLDKVTFYKNYSVKELDRSLPLKHKFNGGECVKRGLMTKMKKMNWHPRYGANDNEVDIECINNLFQLNTTNIIFFGGSSMQNDEAPNYLTTIDYYALKDKFDKYRSINLANSGSRMSNNLSSFIEYVPKIKNVNHIIFFDGINEFTSVQLGADPTYDTYWAQGVRARVNNPELFIVEKLLEKSIVFELIVTKIFNYKSIRDKSNVKFADKKNIKIAANDYLYRKSIIDIYCKKMEIKCHFILQPSIFFDDTRKSYSETIMKYYENLFNENLQLYKFGYSVIKNSKDKNIIDFSTIFNGEDDIFIDAAHFNKRGSEIVGKNFLKVLEKYED